MIGRTDSAALSLDRMSACGNGNWINVIGPHATEIAYLQRDGAADHAASPAR